MLIMKSTPAQWVIVVLGFAIVVGIFSWGSPGPGLDANWLTAVSTTVLAVTAVIGLMGVLRPLQQEAERRRKLHRDKLVTEVIEPIAVELQQEYVGILSRTTFPLDWDNGQGLHWRPASSRFVSAKRSKTADMNVYEKYYNHVKNNHYPALIGHVENFKRDFEIFSHSTLQQAKDLEREIRTVADLPESPTQQGQHWYTAGNIALYVFDRIWMANYNFPLTIRPDHIAQSGFWGLWNEGASKQYARGSEEEVKGLQQRINALFDSQERTTYTKAASELLKRLEHLQSDLAEIQASEKLEGDCPSIR